MLSPGQSESSPWSSAARTQEDVHCPMTSVKASEQTLCRPVLASLARAESASAPCQGTCAECLMEEGGSQRGPASSQEQGHTLMGCSGPLSSGRNQALSGHYWSLHSHLSPRRLGARPWPPWKCPKEAKVLAQPQALEQGDSCGPPDPRSSIQAQSGSVSARSQTGGRS